MARIKDVADAAGVSTATVSRVLSNHPNVRAEVRERVVAVMDKLDYRPNLIARSLRAQHTATLGLIVSDIRNPFFTAVSRAVEDTAYDEGYSVLLCNSDEDPAKELLYLRLMQDANVAGVILSPTLQTIARLPSLKLDFPTVFVDRAVRNLDVDSVVLDNVEAGYRLTNHLIEQGYRRIAGLFGETSTTGRERRQGFEEALRAQGLTPDSARHVPAKVDAGHTAALALLDAARPPEAILTSNSLLAIGILQAIRERRLKIPDAIALACFDETTWAALVEPPITLIAQPTYEIGKTATELLLERIADPTRSTRQVTLKGQLLARGSTAARLAAAAQIAVAPDSQRSA